MEKNMGFGLILGLWAVLKTVQPKLLLATFEGNIFIFLWAIKKKCIFRSKQLHRINRFKLIQGISQASQTLA